MIASTLLQPLTERSVTELCRFQFSLGVKQGLCRATSRRLQKIEGMKIERVSKSSRVTPTQAFGRTAPSHRLLGHTVNLKALYNSETKAARVKKAQTTILRPVKSPSPAFPKTLARFSSSPTSTKALHEHTESRCLGYAVEIIIMHAGFSPCFGKLCNWTGKWEVESQKAHAWCQQQKGEEYGAAAVSSLKNRVVLL